MINTIKLERRWFKYKFKSYLLHFIILIASIIVLLIISIISNTKEKVVTDTTISSKKEIQKEVTPKKQEIIKEKIVSIEKKQLPKKEPSIALVTKKVVIEPSLDFLQEIEKNNVEKKIVPKSKPKITIKEPVQTQIQVIKKERVQKKENSVKITRQNTHTDIQAVINRFEKNHNPALSLFIARQYYKIKEYKKSYNYALKTNEINNNIEDSWIIFAKSLVKLQNKKVAVKMLKKYISHSNSYKASILLDEINSGKFR